MSTDTTTTQVVAELTAAKLTSDILHGYQGVSAAQRVELDRMFTRYIDNAIRISKSA